MKTSPELFDFLKPQDAPDSHLLRGLVDFLVHKRIVEGYSCIVVPQLGEEQGKKAEFSRFRRSVPPAVRVACLDAIEAYDIAVPGPRAFRRWTIDKYTLSFSSIASSYDINIGAVCLLSKKKIYRRDLAFILNAFEGIVSLRKKAVALTFHGEFLQLDMNERRSLDRAVGNIVNKAVNPHETLIFASDESRSRYEVVYSSSNVTLSVSRGGQDPLVHCFRDKKTIIINDTSDRTALLRKFGSDFSIREFLAFKRYLSCILVPVYGDAECYCVVACFFSRKNAVSKTEAELLEITCNILGDYYRLWTERNELQHKIKENARVTGLVRQAILIADIMHDASEDLVTAHAQIGMLQPRPGIETAALAAAKASLKELINAARQFRLFFSKRTRDEDKDKDKPEIAIAKMRTVTAKSDSDTVNVYEIVEELKQKYKLPLDANKIIVRNACSSTFEFAGFKYNIKRAIDNAVRNSIAHLRDKTHVRREITISLREIGVGSKPSLPKRHVEIEVHDNGRGVEPEHLHQVTKPFFSLRGGMGLGLSIIEAACEAQEGQLHITSEWGKDFCVIMSIPLIIKPDNV